MLKSVQASGVVLRKMGKFQPTISSFFTTFYQKLPDKAEESKPKKPNKAGQGQE
jgi:hypothetical protein